MTNIENFQITGIPKSEVSHLFSLSESELTEINAFRMDVDNKPGFPCRVSLQDAEIGEQIIAFSFAHNDVTNPYCASGPIFVRDNATEAKLAPGEIPEYIRVRHLSVRAYDKDSMLVGAEVAPGTEISESINHLFENPKTAYLHLHNAGLGCYLAAVNRA